MASSLSSATLRLGVAEARALGFKDYLFYIKDEPSTQTAIDQAISGRPQTSTRFLRRMPFDPPRAGMIPRIRMITAILPCRSLALPARQAGFRDGVAGHGFAKADERQSMFQRHQAGGFLAT